MNQNRPYEKDQIPSSGETCTVSPYGNRKRASLLFDRIWIGRTSHPLGIEPPPELTFGAHSIDEEIPQITGSLFGQDLAGKLLTGTTEQLQSVVERAVVLAYQKVGVTVIPSFADNKEFSTQYGKGEAVAYQAVLANLPVVNEDFLDWEQILQFRSDKEAVRKYRDLRLWLHHSLNAESVQHATYLISQKIDDYRWAIKKHGMQTVSKGLTQIYDWKDLATAGATSTVVGALGGGPIVSALFAVITVVPKIAAWVIDRRVTLRDVERGKNKEIAIIYEAQKRFGK
jgi:hypothetical protein